MTRAGREVRVVRYPDAAVMPEDFEVVEVPVDDPGPGQVLVRNTWTSVDPGAVQLGGVGTLTRLDISLAEPRVHPGPLGGMGLTAYAGLHVVDALKGGETVWVSAAAGAVGSLASQIAKLCGNRVIASAGSDLKVAWLRDELGVEAFNHRDGDLDGQLRGLAPEGIDVYFDSVGGDHLEAALDHLNRSGRSRCAGPSRSTSRVRRVRATCSSRSRKTPPCAGSGGAATGTSWTRCSAAWPAGSVPVNSSTARLCSMASSPPRERSRR